jgi:hypothetical protein
MCSDNPTAADLEAFAKEFEMMRAITAAATVLLEQVCGGQDIYGPPLPFAELEQFRQAVQRAYEQFVAVPDKAAAPSHLRIVQ